MKRPWLMAAWPLLWLFYSSSILTKVANCSKNKNNDARLKVSIRKDTMLGVPSCQHTFSQIELLNLHSTEPIMIHSIHTIPEETVLVRPDSTPTSSPSSHQSREPEYGRSWNGNDIPQQLHVSKLPSGSLSLGPGQVAIVPVTFLPRYPSPDDCGGGRVRACDESRDDDNNIDDYYSTTVTDGRSPPPLSSTAKLDLVDLVGKRVLKAIDNKRQYLRHTLDPTYRRRNNMNPSSVPRGDEQYEVSTTVIVDTSRGVVKLPISASSVRDNLYRIPDVITFFHPSITKENGDKDGRTDVENEFDEQHSTTTEARKKTLKNKLTGGTVTSMDGAVILDTINASDDDDDDTPGDEKNYPASVLDTVKPERECFDLYLSNPFPDRELQVMEALISRPEFVSVQFDPGRMSAPDLTMLIGSRPSQVLRQWTVDGPLYLPPDSDNHYILTICTAFEGEIEPDEGSETYLDEMSKWIDSGDPYRNLGFLQIRTDAETLFIGLEHAENVPFLSLQSSGSSKNFSSTTPSSKIRKGSNRIESSTLLKSFPDRLDFDMISTKSPALQTTFGLQNKSPVPIRIMRVSVGIDSSGDEQNTREAELIGLNVSVGVRNSGGKVESTTNENFENNLGSLILGSASSLDNILKVTCSLNPDRFFSDSNKESFTFVGTVVIRGTMDTELSYHQWRDETLRNPYRDEHLTLEVPFTVSILNGRVEALIEQSSHPYPQLFAAQSWDGSGRAVSHLFFPMTQYAAVQGTEDMLPQQMYLGANEIRHDLRILSNLAFPMTLVGAKIIDDDDPNTEESLCNRFNVSVVHTSNPNDLYFGFEEIGFIELKYKFGAKGKKGEKQHEFSSPHHIHPYLPKKCSMIVVTSPEEAGKFNIPLLIFPGHLEVSSLDSSVVGTPSENKILLGFSQLLSWCRSSRLGKSFLQILRKSVEERRKSKSDSHLLSKYMTENSGWDQKSKPKLFPILLKIGAIDSGKIAKTDIHLTNHNPIPLSVSIDVGEVEGMAIALSRDASQATGDGNSLLDYLPKQPKTSIVQMGRNKDQPVSGLLNFLTSNEQALEFTSKFNFRDSLSPHSLAIERSDVLQLLYDWHSKASFHRESGPKRSSPKSSAHCDQKLYPPGYNLLDISNHQPEVEGLTGAFIISSDKRLTRPLTECWRRDPAEMSSDRNTVKIPPGATARFEVQVRAPSKEFLKDDISHLLMSGLKLSTNLGDVMPIFVIVEALQGQLHASHSEPVQVAESNSSHDFSLNKNTERKIMSVPLVLSWSGRHSSKKESQFYAMTIPPSNLTAATPYETNTSSFFHDESSSDGIPLYLRSSFSRHIRLLSVESCNPWFKFVPIESTKNVEQSSGSGVLVGFVRSNVDCSSNHLTGNGFPSFYQCMLNWLSDRSKLQPEGCGVKDSNLKLRQMESLRRTIEHGLRDLEKSYKTYVSSDSMHMDFATSPWNESDLSHIKTGRRTNDGLVPDLASYNAIWKALQIANDLGYNSLSSSLRATVEYDSEPLKSIEEDSWNVTAKQNLSLSINDIDVQSVLKAPKLFDDDSDSLEFQPTTVGSVTTALITLRNPTGVPIRVRIGTSVTMASDENLPDGTLRSLLPSTSSEELSRIENMHIPYVQNGKNNFPRNDSTSFSWWDGYGAFFVPNEHGDVIQSHNNISVTGWGGSTSISLVNPSLNAQVGFLVGCAKRCGLRDKNSANTVLGSPMASSPIGASAAAGVTLKGRFRYNSPETNDQPIPEPIIFAGGTPVSSIDGPAAFAIPFSALDEIVIPPFGKGQLGPIYFRPPGRHKTIGCELARQSGAKLDEFKEMLCKTQSFASLLYLENSLTGIEKVGLRGKSEWDNLYFVDPPPKEGEDAFGDIEYREGMPTLFFTGTSRTTTDFMPKTSLFGKRTQHLSVVKEVVLQNDGDRDSYIAMVSLGGMNDKIEEEGTCSYGSFRLLNCWEFSQNIHFFDDENIHSGFVLKPGENRSFFVEHLPDCKRKKEFVTLHVQLSNKSSQRAPELKRSRSRGLKNPFARREINMFLGYHMDSPAFSRCRTAGIRLSDSAIHTDSISMNFANHSSRIELKTFRRNKEERPLLLVQVFLFTTAALMLCYALHERFHAILGMLQRIQGEPTKNVLNWNAAFRCLARSCPTSTELQTMSREQMRQDVIGRYKAKGNMSASSLNSTNGFSRDRRIVISNTLRHRLGKEGSPGNERIRPFSDALFHDTSIADDSSLRIHFPIGLGWRTAYSRGIIKDNSLLQTSFSSRTKNLLQKRAFVSSEKDRMDDEEKDDEEDMQVIKTNCVEEPGQKDSSSLTTAQISNFADNEASKNEASKNEASKNEASKNEASKNEVVQSTNTMSTSESEVTAPNEPKSNHSNDFEIENKDAALNSTGENRSSVTKKVTSSPPSTTKEIPSKTASKVDKQSKKKVEISTQPIKNLHHSDLLKRSQKMKIQAQRSNDRESSKKIEKNPKNPPWGQSQKPKVPGKIQSDILGPLAKSGTPKTNAWHAERQKTDSGDLLGQKASIAANEKSKTKEKSKKRTTKQNVEGKKTDPSPSINRAALSEASIGTVPYISQAQLQTTLTPPPGFGGPQIKVPLSPNGNGQLPSISVTDSQLSLEKLLSPVLTGGSNDTDISLGAPSQAPLHFSHSSSGGGDLLFRGSIHEPNASPIIHRFNVADVRMTTENSSALTHPPEEPWLPPLINEETDVTEQPWLPALLNGDAESGFDVMDFLDGILQDGSTAKEEPALEIESSSPGTPAKVATGSVGNSTTPVSDNPWARESRAAAYGISFDDEEGNAARTSATGLEKTITGGLGGNIPFLTPAAILNAEERNAIAQDEEDKTVSYYAGLLGE
eukprot:jgi/Psemu1/283966/fgenesh1_pg.39_\